MFAFPRIKIIATSLVIGALIPSLAHGHARWVVPSHSVVSGDKPVAISLDYSISNDIFHPDIAIGGTPLDPAVTPEQNGPMATALTQTRAQVTLPNGEQMPLHSVNLGRKTSSLFSAASNGTYRVDIVQPAIDITLYKTAAGEEQRLFGPLKAVKNQLPEGAKDIESLQFNNRIQTFVTRNQSTQQALVATGQGLELKHQTHPNELFSGETSRYQVLLNGKALSKSQGLHIKITQAGTRFRNQRNSLEPAINNQGEFSVPWPQAGLYLLEAEYELPQKGGKVVYALFLTLEVMPE